MRSSKNRLPRIPVVMELLEARILLSAAVQADLLVVPLEATTPVDSASQVPSGTSADSGTSEQFDSTIPADGTAPTVDAGSADGSASTDSTAPAGSATSADSIVTTDDATTSDGTIPADGTTLTFDAGSTDGTALADGTTPTDSGTSVDGTVATNDATTSDGTIPADGTTLTFDVGSTDGSAPVTMTQLAGTSADGTVVADGATTSGGTTPLAGTTQQDGTVVVDGTAMPGVWSIALGGATTFDLTAVQANGLASGQGTSADGAIPLNGTAVAEQGVSLTSTAGDGNVFGGTIGLGAAQPVCIVDGASLAVDATTGQIDLSTFAPVDNLGVIQATLAYTASDVAALGQNTAMPNGNVHIQASGTKISQAVLNQGASLAQFGARNIGQVGMNLTSTPLGSINAPSTADFSAGVQSASVAPDGGHEAIALNVTPTVTGASTAGATVLGQQTDRGGLEQSYSFAIQEAGISPEFAIDNGLVTPNGASASSPANGMDLDACFFGITGVDTVVVHL